LKCILYTVILFLFLALLMVGAALVGSFAAQAGTYTIPDAVILY
jgi:hypothetical protein